MSALALIGFWFPALAAFGLLAWSMDRHHRWCPAILVDAGLSPRQLRAAGVALLVGCAVVASALPSAAMAWICLLVAVCWAVIGVALTLTLLEWRSRR